jgi:hypothetical protein
VSESNLLVIGVALSNDKIKPESVTNFRADIMNSSIPAVVINRSFFQICVTRPFYGCHGSINYPFNNNDCIKIYLPI